MADSKQLTGGIRGSESGTKEVHHGRTWAAWAGSLGALVAFFIGGIAVILQNWVLFGIAVVLLAASGIAVKVLQRAGHGAD